jgi:hypothetical protein
MVVNLLSCGMTALKATRLEADDRNDKEIEHYCESFELRQNWDMLLNRTSGPSWGFLRELILYLTSYGSIRYIL